ncbi:tripartite tricarboxylate transporter TctB family protein [Bradyrhizobium sp. LHD-71]|uniref:tripartite tricarboxylate transporter TctB family protein n=1 Tax=Bradyrhizobium sp. LHD-71 TaxID=3072141 RepID=UPI00280FE6C5|nr:tripartite tricarboxylate transporter TctB family protein [Bradyrhizobium sp. LHD-71]MDQ8728244.1 tripartite tricarboxylate transporter TctB family protein [Bradyrhizobium sp. LHD-71]
MVIRNQRAFGAGVLFLAAASFYFFTSFNYVTGTAGRMGPGFFPKTVSILLALVSVGIIISAVSPRATIEKLEPWDFKGLFWIAGSVVLFGVALDPLGLVCALVLLIIVSSLASPEFGWRGAIINTIVLVIFCLGVFVYGINLQFPVWPVWFR